MTDHPMTRPCPRCGGRQVVLMLAGRQFVWACTVAGCFAALEPVRARHLEASKVD
jgi:hypothetical protein